MEKIKVLLVDDSVSFLAGLKIFLQQYSHILEIVGSFTSARNGIDYLKNNKVDVILLDMNMPIMDGCEATKLIMESYPTPIILLTSASRYDPKVIKALHSGAIDFIPKPGYEVIIEKIKQASIVNAGSYKKLKKPLKRRSLTQYDKKIDLITIGVSTGGPTTLSTLFSSLPSDFSIPILVVQHIRQGYSEGLAHVLQKKCKINIKVAEDGELIKKGHIYIGEAGKQFEVKKDRVFLTNVEPDNLFKPSVDVLFKSAVKTFKGHILGIILTGMGHDGLIGCEMYKKNGHNVIIQDKETSIVWGMPGAVHKAGFYDHIYSLSDILNLILEL